MLNDPSQDVTFCSSDLFGFGEDCGDAPAPEVHTHACTHATRALRDTRVPCPSSPSTQTHTEEDVFDLMWCCRPRLAPPNFPLPTSSATGFCCSAHLPYVAVGAMDAELHGYMTDLGVPTWHMGSKTIDKSAVKNDFGWGSSNFHKMGRVGTFHSRSLHSTHRLVTAVRSV